MESKAKLSTQRQTNNSYSNLILFAKLTVESSAENRSSLAAAVSFDEQNSFPGNKNNTVESADTKVMKHKTNFNRKIEHGIPPVGMLTLFLVPSLFPCSNLKS